MFQGSPSYVTSFDLYIDPTIPCSHSLGHYTDALESRELMMDPEYHDRSMIGS